MVFVRQKEAETVPANGGFSRVGERSETRLVFWTDLSHTQTIEDTKLWCQRSRSDLPSRTSCLGSFSCTWVPPSEGSVEVLRVENVRCRQIRASICFWSLLTFSCTMRKFRSRPAAAFLPRASTFTTAPLPLPPQEPAVTVGWGNVPEQERLRTVKILKGPEVSRRNVSQRGGGFNN